jgi:hypothetical protein
VRSRAEFVAQCLGLVAQGLDPALGLEAIVDVAQDDGDESLLPWSGTCTGLQVLTTCSHGVPPMA